MILCEISTIGSSRLLATLKWELKCTADKRQGKYAGLSMDFPAASHGVSMKDKFNPTAACCGELNPTDFEISTSHSL
jgi:hypothetical protein